MAWEDRTPAEKRRARREAAAYDATNDSEIYAVVTPKGTRLTVKGIHSARVTAGKTGTYRKR